MPCRHAQIRGAREGWCQEDPRCHYGPIPSRIRSGRRAGDEPLHKLHGPAPRPLVLHIVAIGLRRAIPHLGVRVPLVVFLDKPGRVEQNEVTPADAERLVERAEVARGG